MKNDCTCYLMDDDTPCPTCEETNEMNNNHCRCNHCVCEGSAHANCCYCLGVPCNYCLEKEETNRQ